MKIKDVVRPKKMVYVRNDNVIRNYRTSTSAEKIANVLRQRYPNVSFAVCAHPMDPGYAILAQKSNQSHAYVGFGSGPSTIAV